MILKGSQRGGVLKLAAHLMNMVKNDHVEVHELRGFSCDNLRDVLQEVDAIAKGTKCQQFLYSPNFKPPETERVGPAPPLHKALHTCQSAFCWTCLKKVESTN